MGPGAPPPAPLPRQCEDTRPSSSRAIGSEQGRRGPSVIVVLWGERDCPWGQPSPDNTPSLTREAGTGQAPPAPPGRENYLLPALGK